MSAGTSPQEHDGRAGGSDGEPRKRRERLRADGREPGIEIVDADSEGVLEGLPPVGGGPREPEVVEDGGIAGSLRQPLQGEEAEPGLGESFGRVTTLDHLEVAEGRRRPPGAVLHVAPLLARVAAPGLAVGGEGVLEGPFQEPARARTTANISPQLPEVVVVEGVTGRADAAEHSELDPLVPPRAQAVRRLPAHLPEVQRARGLEVGNDVAGPPSRRGREVLREEPPHVLVLAEDGPPVLHGYGADEDDRRVGRSGLPPVDRLGDLDPERVARSRRRVPGSIRLILLARRIPAPCADARPLGQADGAVGQDAHEVPPGLQPDHESVQGVTAPGDGRVAVHIHPDPGAGPDVHRVVTGAPPRETVPLRRRLPHRHGAERGGVPGRDRQRRRPARPSRPRSSPGPGRW